MNELVYAITGVTLGVTAFFLIRYLCLRKREQQNKELNEIGDRVKELEKELEDDLRATSASTQTPETIIKEVAENLVKGYNPSNNLPKKRGRKRKIIRK